MQNSTRFVLAILMTVFINIGYAQTMTEQQAVDMALKNSPVLGAASLQVQQSKQLQKAVFNLPNPVITIESPTGEFYVGGIQQSFEFPLVYSKQVGLQKAQSQLAQTGLRLSEADVKYRIRQLYLELQYRQALAILLQAQDSIYNAIMLSAQRQFDAGQIDYLEKTFADSRYGQAHNEHEQAQTDALLTMQQLQMYTGFGNEKDIILQPLSKREESLPQTLLIAFDTTYIADNPSIVYAVQQQKMSFKNLSIQRYKALPGFSLGYLNQGAANTANYYRFNVGFTIPLWFWQYQGNIKAAKIATEIAGKQLQAQQQAISAELQQAIANYVKYSRSLAYYYKQGLQQANAITNTAKRFFESGESDYINYLRTLSDAYVMRLKYLENLKNHNQSILYFNYLQGL